MRRLLIIPLLISIILLKTTSVDYDIVQCKGNAKCLDTPLLRVVDGDTLEIDGYVVRLSLVNTPEKTEPGFYEAKEFLEKNCPMGENILVDEDDGQISRSHRRLLAKIYCKNGTFNLNKELLDSGNAALMEDFCTVSEFSDELWAVENGCSIS